MKEPLSTLRHDMATSAVVVLALLAYGALAANAYQLRLLALVGCYAIAVIGYQRLFGDLGLLSLAQGAFFAIGAYAVALLDTDLFLAIGIAVVAASAVALFCSLILLRLGSHYLALASLAFAMLVLLAAVNLERWTGGANGLSLQPTTFDNLSLALIAWGGVMVAALAYWLSSSGLKILRRHLLRELPRAAAAIGLSAVTWQRTGFIFAAALAGLGGALYARVSGVVSPQVAELGLMVNLLAATVIGGRGKVAGALLGALLLVLLPELLRFAGNWYLFLWALTLLAMLIVAPAGLAGLLDALPIRFRSAVGNATSNPTTAAADLRLEDLHKSFGGVVAVDGVSLTLQAGQAIAVIGANGAGKTTLLNLLCGTERADAGRILWRDTEVAALPVHQRARLGIGRSFQTSQLPAGQATIDAIASATQDRVQLAAARGQAMALLQRLGLADRAYLAVERLSPAQRRLVEIARAMMPRPALLALDEPTAGLDQAERDHLAQVLSGWRQQGLALFIVEHDIAFASAVADRLACMEAGRVVALGTPQSLRPQPSLQRFFGAAR